MFRVEEMMRESTTALRKLTLIGGAGGLDREISWPNPIMDFPISQWLKPGEMVIISGAGMTNEESQLLQIVEQAAAGEASCLVIMTSKLYIPEIPGSVCSKADLLNIPLFSAPWDLPVGVLMNEVSSLIEKGRLKGEVLSQLMYELFSADADEESCQERAKLYGHDLNRAHRVVIIKLDNMKEVLQNKRFASEAETYSYKSRIRIFVEKSLNAEGVLCLSGLQKSQLMLVCDCEKRSREQLEACLNRLGEKLLKHYPELTVRMGFSRICREVREYARARKEALTAALFSRHGGLVSSFEETGVLSRLLSGTDRTQLQEIEAELMGRLETEDMRENGELVHTLETYLLNNGNAMRTAQKLYIHRNTLLKRLEKISDLLQADLEDAYVRNDLLNVLVIRRYLR